MWVLIQSLGTTASPGPVFASFMISSVFRTVGIVPGGLGTFEATSVWTLNMMGVAIPIGARGDAAVPRVEFLVAHAAGLVGLAPNHGWHRRCRDAGRSAEGLLEC